MANKDYYQSLGVSRNATQEQIRKAFKKLARENHPDAKPGDAAAAERFKEAAEAYDVLGDEESRKKYDQFGANWKHFKEGQTPYGGGRGQDPFRQGGPVDIDLRDLFGGGGAVDLGDLFGGMFGGGRSARGASGRRGQDLAATIEVPFSTAAEGGKFDLTFQRNGRSETLTITIPPGIDEGQTIRLAKQGDPGIGGGAPGDLLVTVRVASHPYFRREGRNLVVEVPITIAEAALGARIDVPTLNEGLVTMTLPPGTSSGTRLRLKGKGIPDRRSGNAGDQFVQIKIVAPKKLDERSRELLQEFAERNPDGVRDQFH